MKHIVMFSGGIGSYIAAKRVIAKHGKESVTLLFCDTLMEDEDLYRFLDEASAKLGVPITRLCKGMTPWEVCEKQNIIANSKIDPCSKVLKRELLDRWRNENCEPDSTIVYMGIDWSESHRLTRILDRVKPWIYEAPLVTPPYHTKSDLIRELRDDGIEIPRLYKMGFAHNNCGGFCFKAGQKAFAILLREMPERYAFHEGWENKMRLRVGDHAVMRDRKGGVTRQLTMTEFRERVESSPDIEFYGDLAAGCGCAID